MPSKIAIKPFRGKCRASVRAPGSKSITNRALLLAALAGGKTVLNGALFSRDTLIMADCLSRLGYVVSLDKYENKIYVESVLDAVPNSEADLFVGNAGTAARFITALVALRGKGGRYFFDSDKAMYSRPIKGLVNALKSQGAQFDFLGEENHFPFRVKTCGLHGGEILIDAEASSQMLSALLMVSPMADTPVTVKLIGETVSRPFVDMTLKVMREFGFESNVADKNTFEIAKSQKHIFQEREFNIEPDATASSYFAMLPAIVGGVCELQGFADCRLQGDAAFVGLIEELGLIKTEKTGDNLLVFASGSKVFPQKVELDFKDISDTFLTLAAVSPLLPFELKIKGIAHTRRQETDRVSAMATELRKFCARVEEHADGIEIVPFTRDELRKKISAPVLVNTYDDHRIAMSFSILASADIFGDGREWIEIENPDCVSKTWENFFEELYSARSSSDDLRVVAVDGGAAVGKSSVSKECARILDYMHIDTGAHYRTVAYGLLENSISPLDGEAVKSHLKKLKIGTVLDGNSAKITLNGVLVPDSEIRTERINANVAQFAAMQDVRSFLKNYQRSMSDFARENGFSGMIMEGRDIGSVIFPDANVRIFLDADEETRAKRRANEGIRDSISRRDELDKTRKTAPLLCPDGAELIDTSKMTKEQVVAKTLSLILES